MKLQLQNIFPFFGGAAGAVLEPAYSIQQLLITCLSAFIGAVIGYFVKMLFDYYFNKKDHEN